MRNRELIMKKLEHLEIKMNVLRMKVNGSSPVNEYISEIDNTRDIIEEVKSMIEREPRTSDELNKQ